MFGALQHATGFCNGLESVVEESSKTMMLTKIFRWMKGDPEI